MFMTLHTNVVRRWRTHTHFVLRLGNVQFIYIIKKYVVDNCHLNLSFTVPTLLLGTVLYLWARLHGLYYVAVLLSQLRSHSSDFYSEKVEVAFGRWLTWTVSILVPLLFAILRLSYK